MTPLQIADQTFESRLIMGSANFPNAEVMRDALNASGSELVTVAIRRTDLQGNGHENTLKYLKQDGYSILPNTAACFTAKEAVLTAQLAREALGTNWVKLEVIGDEETLFPDIPELLKATEQLLKEDFVVLPYTNDDPITAKKLSDMGCAAVMPLGAPIGSGMGVRNPHNLMIIRDQIDAPMIVDAGVGTASDASNAMEIGADGVLLNSAVAQAKHPVQMGEAMKLGVQAGKLAYESGRIAQRLYAKASSPMEGMIGSKE